MDPTEGVGTVGRRFRLGPGRGDSGRGKEVAVDSKKGVNLRISSGGEEGQVVRLTPRAGQSCRWLLPFQDKTRRLCIVSLSLL